MKRIDVQKEIGAAAKRVAARQTLSGVTAGPSCFVNGTPFNALGAILAEAQKAGTGARILLPRKMNGLNGVQVLCLALGVSQADIPKPLVDLIDDLETVDSLTDSSRELIKELTKHMSTLIGRSPGRPKNPPKTKSSADVVVAAVA